MTLMTLQIQAKLDGVNWTDISGDVAGFPDASSGIFGNGDSDRVADVGKLNFRLKNSTANSAGIMGYYSPGGAYCRSGFAVGLPVRAVFTFDGSSHTKWKGEIIPDGILAAPGIHLDRQTAVTCYDWMHQANIHRLNLVQYTTNKKGDEVINLLLANMPKQPDNKTLDVGTYTFTSVFDTVRNYTTAMSEMQKVCQSERSYLYLRDDETLIWENRTHRDNLPTLTVVPMPSALCDTIDDESDDALLDEDGNALLQEDTYSVDFNDTMVSMDASYGDNLFNKVNYTVYPKEEFTGTLGLTQTRTALKAGETKTGIKLSYRDPTGGAAKVCLKTLTAIVSNTDYKMSANQDGTGADLIADLVVTCDAGVEGAEWTIQNTGATDGYVYLQVRGTGLRIYDPVTKITEDTASQALYGVLEMTVNAQYQNDPVVGDQFSNLMLLSVKSPARTIKKATFITTSDAYRSAFLSMEIGDKIRLSETVTGVAEDYFIQGIEWSVIGYNAEGAIIQWSWYVKRAILDLLTFAKWDTEGKWDSQYARWYL